MAETGSLRRQQLDLQRQISQPNLTRHASSPILAVHAVARRQNVRSTSAQSGTVAPESAAVCSAVGSIAQHPASSSTSYLASSSVSSSSIMSRAVRPTISSSAASAPAAVRDGRAPAAQGHTPLTSASASSEPTAPFSTTHTTHTYTHAGASDGHRRSRRRARQNIAMVCDFFYPRVGGVEMHIWSLSQCLIRRGHKVVVITHSYGGRKGVRYMTNGLKVYYLPITPMVDENALPTTFAWFPLFREILIREEVSIVHGHQATSSMMHEATVQARTMGYRVCYTDHSLFGFADAASINVNKMLKYTLSDIDHCICVSHTCRENLVLRASVDPHKVSTIPNAVDATKFRPDPSARRPKHSINVVLMSRLVYRKGIDLAVEVIPRIAAKYPNTHFIVGGDGPKRLLFEEMLDKHRLHERVELLGSVPHAQVRNVLVRGHIFLNTSLTESFCIAILEAACCGLYVVSTKVGGIPEVLPPDMLCLAQKNTVDGLERALERALGAVNKVVPSSFHERVSRMYDWNDVAERVERVYHHMLRLPQYTLLQRLGRYRTVGLVAGLVACMHMAVLYLVWRVLEYVRPASQIERAVGFDYKTYTKNQNKLHADDGVAMAGSSNWSKVVSSASRAGNHSHGYGHSSRGHGREGHGGMMRRSAHLATRRQTRGSARRQQLIDMRVHAEQRKQQQAATVQAEAQVTEAPAAETAATTEATDEDHGYSIGEHNI